MGAGLLQARRLGACCCCLDRALKREKEDKENRSDQDGSSLSKLQDEKMRLLRELAARSGGSVGGPEGSGGAGNLGEMLLEAENQKRQLEAQLGESQADVAALRKQLMKAMKDAAKPG